MVSIRRIFICAVVGVSATLAQQEADTDDGESGNHKESIMNAFLASDFVMGIVVNIKV